MPTETKERFEMFAMLEKFLACLYAPPWGVAMKEWERMSGSFSEDGSGSPEQHRVR